MAPVREVVGSWATSFYPETAIFSLLLLFLLSVFLLILCTDCGRHSFELHSDGVEVERTPSTLIRVVRLEDALAARENPAADDIRKDEREFTSTPEAGVPVSVSVPAAVSASDPGPAPEVQIISGQDPSTWYKPWRGHTGALEQHGSPTELQQASGSPVVLERRSPSLNSNTHIGEVSSLSSTTDPQPSPVHSDSVLHSAPPPAFTDSPEPLPGERGPDQGPQPSVEDPLQHIYDVIGEEQRAPVTPPGESLLDHASTMTHLVTPGYESLTELNCTSTPIQPPALHPAPAPPTEEGFCILSTISLVEEVEEGLSDRGWNPMYAKVSRKHLCPTPPPIPPPEDDEDEEEESSPPLPDRSP